jgi:hypothetical protein
MEPGDRRQKADQAMGDTICNLALAYACARGIGAAAGIEAILSDEGLGLLLVVMLTVMHADPMGSWRRGRALRVVLLRGTLGAVIGGCLYALLPDGAGGPAAAADPLGPTPDAAGGAAGEAAARGGDGAARQRTGREGGGGVPQPVWVSLVALMAIALAPWLESLLRPRRPRGVSLAERAQIGAAFPLFTLAMAGLNLGLLTAFWSLGLPLPVAFALMLAAVLLCVSETWAAPPEDLPPDPDAPRWGPPVESARAAWAGLGKAIGQTMASALFLASALYIAFELARPAFPAPGSLAMTDPGSFAAGMLMGAALVVAAALGLFALGAAALALAAWALGRMKGADALSIAELIRYASHRLFAGGIHHVRPDLEDE